MGQGTSEGVDGAVGQPRGNGAGLGVAVQDSVDDVVDGTGADGVVGGVAHHLEPGDLEEAGGVLRRVLEEGGQWFGPALQLALGEGATALDIDPVRGDAHEHVGPGTRTKFTFDQRQALGGGTGQIVGEGRHLELEIVLQVVGLGHDPAEPGLRHEVVRTVHAQEITEEKVGHLVHVVARAADERLGIVGHRRRVAVPDGQVLGPDRGAVRGRPGEGVLGHLGGDAAPDHRVVESCQSQDLGHLGDVAEHVRQIAQLHDAPEGGAATEAHLEVAHDGLARGEELVHQDVPGPHADPAGCGERPKPPLGLRADLEVVVHHGHLPVQHEVGIAGVALEQGEEGVDQLHQGEAEILVRLVPFPVPMCVRNDGNPASGHDRQTMTCRRRW